MYELAQGLLAFDAAGVAVFRAPALKLPASRGVRIIINILSWSHDRVVSYRGLSGSGNWDT